MAIKQLTVFVENKQGSLVSITDTLSKHEVNIRALSIAETQDFGMLRCNFVHGLYRFFQRIYQKNISVVFKAFLGRRNQIIFLA